MMNARDVDDVYVCSMQDDDEDMRWRTHTSTIEDYKHTH